MHTDTTDPSPKENLAIPVTLYLAIAVGTIMAALLGSGFAMMGATSYKIGPYAGYGAGLMMVGVSVTLTVAVGALLLHRVGFRDNAKTRGAVRDLHDEVCEIDEKIARMSSGMEELAKAVQAIQQALAEMDTAGGEEVATVRAEVRLLGQRLKTVHEEASEQRAAILAIQQSVADKIADQLAPRRRSG